MAASATEAVHGDAGRNRPLLRPRLPRGRVSLGRSLRNPVPTAMAPRERRDVVPLAPDRSAPSGAKPEVGDTSAAKRARPESTVVTRGMETRTAEVQPPSPHNRVGGARQSVEHPIVQLLRGPRP